ncbi:MAG: TRAP transporter substrate-binding protein DctP [Spirochaetaceae bacterium]|nr:MAG: TRAP transporter substrate-binding protein DctP [Spirochaetaceae bacterium]
MKARRLRLYTRLYLLILLMALLLLLPGMSSAALTIKVASLVPEGSPWHRALIKIAGEWRKISNGQIQLKIYPGGIAGDETDAIRKMRINQIQAAMVTGKGLAYIHPDFYVYQLPFVARSDEELDHLFIRLGPELETLLEDKGFTLLGLSKSGWLRFFTSTEATAPEEIRRLKLFSLEGHTDIDQAMKAMGFQIVPLKANDVFAAMQSGMVEAFAASPLVAASMQWFALAPHMNSFYWSPLTGGLVITNRAWRMIPSDLHSQLLISTKTILEELYEETLEVERQAIDIMEDNGLVIHSVTEDTIEQWRNLVDQGFSMLVGDTISPEIYEQTMAILREYRNR